MSGHVVLPPHGSSGLRAAALSVASVCSLGAAAALALYLSAAVFLLVNKADPSQARLSSLFDYWQLYADDARLRKQLIASTAVVAVGVFVLLPLGVASSLRRRRPLHGDARFAGPREITKSGLLERGGNQGPGILVGRYRGQFLALRGQLSVMLAAPTRSGKGVGVVVPNLLNWPHSVVVLDIKGENYEITAGFRSQHGQRVYAFSPFDEEGRSHRWNPLSQVRTDPMHRVSDLLGVGQCFFPSDSGGSLESFFSDQARNLFLGVGLYLLETPELPRTMGEMLRQVSGKGRSVKDHLASAIADRASSERPLSDECVDALQRLLTTSENTLSSIVATFNAPLTIFADAIVDAATSGDDFCLDDVRRHLVSIYVRVPPNKLANARPLLNLFFSQLVNLNTKALPEQDAGLRYQCLLVNDEFTALGRVGAISNAAAFLAGYNLRLLTVIQAMSQLDTVYGEKEARTFATNHGMQVLYAPREQKDAEEYSAMLGHFTEQATTRGRSRSFSGRGSTTVSRSTSEQRRALLLPQEFKELGSERLVLISESCKPILADKIRYYSDPAFRDRHRAPPVVPKLSIELHFARIQQRTRDLLDEEVDVAGTVDLSRVAHSFESLPGLNEQADDAAVSDYVSRFFAQLGLDPIGEGDSGGSIEVLAADDAEARIELAALERNS